ncbi:MAG: GNAT family N-acetyltransferase [Myxococcales bacterium]|nr:GNAT family N-acetyltransferase [Myxococcales bacterium]
MPIALRKARKADLDALVRIHTAAYPDDRDAAARRRGFERTGMGTFADTHVAVLDGEVAGHAFLRRSRAFFGGRPVALGAVASVGVAPEARGRGVGAALMAHLHRISEARGDALTMLYAFKRGFYDRLGYGPSRPATRLVLSPRAIPSSWRASVVHVGKGRLAEVRAVYASVAAGSTGWLARSDVWWTRWSSHPRRCVLGVDAPRGKGLRGYVSFFLEQRESHAETRLYVDELVAVGHDVRRALVGALGAMRDQVSEIELETAQGDPLCFALVDPDRLRFGTDVVEHAIGDVVTGPLVRVGSPARALEARGYLADGSVDLVVTDEDGAREAVGVDVRRGRGRARPGRTRDALEVDRRTFASLLFGGLAASDAHALGWLGGSDRAIARADAVLRLPAPAPVDRF